MEFSTCKIMVEFLFQALSFLVRYESIFEAHLPLNLPFKFKATPRIDPCQPCQHLHSVHFCPHVLRTSENTNVFMCFHVVEVPPWSLAGQHFLQKDWRHWSSRVAWAQMDISSHLKSWRLPSNCKRGKLMEIDLG